MHVIVEEKVAQAAKADIKEFISLCRKRGYNDEDVDTVEAFVLMNKGFLLAVDLTINALSDNEIERNELAARIVNEALARFHRVSADDPESMMLIPVDKMFQVLEKTCDMIIDMDVWMSKEYKLMKE